MPTTQSKATRYRIDRLGIVMQPDPDLPYEAWGVLNPAVARDPQGDLLMFPRVVAADNYSRIGIARVKYDAAGDPCDVERMGYALEPETWFERNPLTGGGCEDPRVTFVPSLGVYVMAYSAYGPRSSRVALAVSSDLLTWRRIGLADFGREDGVDFNYFDNKDAFVLPEPVVDPHGRPALALVHRPVFQMAWPSVGSSEALPDSVSEARPGIWLSYCPLESLADDLSNLGVFRNHRPVAWPEHDWESLKVGGGTPVVPVEAGWLAVHHGVTGRIIPDADHQPEVEYQAGVMIHDRDDPTKIVYRSSEPVLSSELVEEREGIVNNVVFPTGIDLRPDGKIDVYYGMADARIGAGRLVEIDETARVS